MSAVLVAVFPSHTVADTTRSRLVKDGFPTDRVDLISPEELGPVELVPRGTLNEQLEEYFRTVFQTQSGDSKRSVELAQRAVLDGRAILTVHPRGELETERASQLLRDAGPLEVQVADLGNVGMEHAAAETETPVITWVGKALAAPGAPDTTGTAKLP